MLTYGGLIDDIVTDNFCDNKLLAFSKKSFFCYSNSECPFVVACKVFICSCILTFGAVFSNDRAFGAAYISIST